MGNEKNIIKISFLTLICLICCTSCSSLKTNYYWCPKHANAYVRIGGYYHLPDSFKLLGHTYKQQGTNKTHGELEFIGYVYNKATYEEMKVDDDTLKVAIDNKNSMCHYDCGDGWYNQLADYNIKMEIYRPFLAQSAELYKEIYIGDILYT